MKAFKTNSWFWDCYARCYDGLRRTVPYQRLIEQVVTCVPSNARTLLDAGCGTGNLLEAVHQRHPALRLHGLDFSEAMLGRAKTKVSEAILTTGDLSAALPYPTGFFDVVTCINKATVACHDFDHRRDYSTGNCPILAGAALAA